MLSFTLMWILLLLISCDQINPRFQDTNSRFDLFDFIKSLYFNPKTRWIFEQDKEVINCEDSQFCYAVENDVECKYTITPIRENFGAKITGLNLG